MGERKWRRSPPLRTKILATASRVIVLNTSFDASLTAMNRASKTVGLLGPRKTLYLSFFSALPRRSSSPRLD